MKSAASRRLVGVPPITLNDRIGKSAGVIFSDSISVPAGSRSRARPMAASVSWRERHMSVPSANCSAISAAPRMMRVRIRRTPITVARDSSSGRTTEACICSGGTSPERATTTMRGNSTSG